MKKLLLILLCLPIIGFGQGSIISLTISPVNPNNTDTVYIYAELLFTSSGCPLDMKSHSVLGNNIVASTQHCLGMLTTICNTTDTFKLNPLAVGTYTFDLTLSSGFGGPPCTSGIIPDDYDTITFNISTSVQQTYVPDDNFENYLEANGMGNGISNDDYVSTANINTVTYLSVSNLNITDLTGIEDFIALTDLYCLGNQLTILDVSQNIALTHLGCDNNQLTSLDVNNNTLTHLFCWDNQLTSLDLTANTALWWLECQNNQLTSLDVSQNAALTDLDCSNNQLTTLNVRNGNNSNFTNFDATVNPYLGCINVDDANWSTTNWTVANSNIDTQQYFSNNCSGTTDIQEHTANKQLLKTIDLLGRETKNNPLFYIYDDGTVEKRITIE